MVTSTRASASRSCNTSVSGDSPRCKANTGTRIPADLQPGKKRRSRAIGSPAVARRRRLEGLLSAFSYSPPPEPPAPPLLVPPPVPPPPPVVPPPLLRPPLLPLDDAPPPLFEPFVLLPLVGEPLVPVPPVVVPFGTVPLPPAAVPLLLPEPPLFAGVLVPSRVSPASGRRPFVLGAAVVAVPAPSVKSSTEPLEFPRSRVKPELRLVPTASPPADPIAVVSTVEDVAAADEEPAGSAVTPAASVNTWPCGIA